ncbi:protein of unknown function [Methanoculleus bourgensis]|uniref:Uncharacterized protein n=1 Tax=Methanoculleus bourgensis TaxID=83986 RepID=A0A0X3BMZ5_9EURY|nr:protein of unknown function [Methanoculleus bourgensis]
MKALTAHRRAEALNSGRDYPDGGISPPPSNSLESQVHIAWRYLCRPVPVKRTPLDGGPRCGVRHYPELERIPTPTIHIYPSRNQP